MRMQRVCAGIFRISVLDAIPVYADCGMVADLPAGQRTDCRNRVCTVQRLAGRTVRFTVPALRILAQTHCICVRTKNKESEK